MQYELYSWNTPNGQKVRIALEEAGADYVLHPIDIGAGDQHAPSFRSISPDGKIPALVVNTEPPLSLFESGAILLYLAEQFPVLHGRFEAERALVLSWTFWQVAQLGPLAGQFGRFSGESPQNSAAVAHFSQSLARCLQVLEKRLLTTEYLAGDHFTVADVASYPWIASPQSYLQRFDLDWRGDYTAIARWADQISERPAVKKILSI